MTKTKRETKVKQAQKPDALTLINEALEDLPLWSRMYLSGHSFGHQAILALMWREMQGVKGASQLSETDYNELFPVLLAALYATARPDMPQPSWRAVGANGR